MAVWLLDGPTEVTKIPSSGGYSINWQYYYPGRGLLLISGFATCVVALDGVCSDVGIAQIYPRGFWPQQQKVLSLNIYGEHAVEPRVFMQQRTGPDNNTNIGVPEYAMYARLADRRVYPSGGRIHGTVDGIDTLEGPSIPYNTGGCMVGPGRRPTEIFLSGNHGFGAATLVFYDTETKEFSSPFYHIGMTCNMLAYCPEFDVMVSAHSGDRPVESPPAADQLGAADDLFEIRIWAMEVQPTIVGPVTVARGVVKSGQVVTYQVKVTGEHNDPAENELVDWAVEGSGFLMNAQSKTDANGIAQTMVMYLLDETGTSEVTASVVC